MAEDTPNELDGTRPYLDGLQGMQDLFQLDGFVKAAAKGGKGLTRLFSKTKSKSSSAQFTIVDLLMFQNDPIPASLLKLSGDHASRAVKMFQGVLKYQGETGEKLDGAQKVDIAQKLLHQGLKRAELKDELFMQLLKQTNGNPSLDSKIKGWELMQLTAATMPPSKDFVTLVSEYIHGVAQDATEEEEVQSIAARTWTYLKRSAKAGPRRTLPSSEEIDALFEDRKLNTIVFFLDGTFEELSYDVTSSVLESTEQLAGIIRLQNYSTFTLFESRRPISGKAPQGASGEPIIDEHLLLDDNRYIADVMCEFRNSKMAKEGYQSKLLFKKRMFRETDETITELQFVNLSYLQAQYDYLQGNYPVVREDAAQLCALQMQAEHAADTDSESFMTYIEQNITKQVLMTRPREEWVADVTARYRALEQFSKEDARMQFLRILRSLPYGNSIFFAVKRVEDPIGLLPAKLILGINKRGVHFFRPIPKEYLHSAELRDIMQFGSSSTAVFFKMRVAGVLHIFQFETRQGEDICMALQTHINDIMMKRYSKTTQAKAMSGEGLTGADPAAIAQGTQRHDQDVSSLQKALEDAQLKMHEMQKLEDKLRHEKDQLSAELEDVTEQLHKEEEGKKALEQQVEQSEAELAAAKESVSSVRTESASAAAAGAAIGAAASVAGSRTAELEGVLNQRTLELAETNEKLVAVDKKCIQLQKEKELIEKKMQRIEKSKEQSTKELREQLDMSQENVRQQLKTKDQKITGVMDELATVNALYNEALVDLEQSKADDKELSELRLMKAAIDTKEKQQAGVIEDQAKRLDEVEKQYKDEQVTRKKYFNQMQDMRGKIRVFCRVRPMLKFELDRGQQFGLNLPDELTITHPWKEEKKHREYNFDTVFNPGCNQDQVFEDTKHLVQSAIDGYNVCLFAYGQTGSGKTFTIYGSEKDPGLTPRGVNELFQIIDKDAGKYTFSVSMYMLELYQETLLDLLAAKATPRMERMGSMSMSARKAEDDNRLEIKKDPKGMVVVNGATVVEVTSAKQLTAAIEAGQQRRHVASTQMNRESSRSHLVISIIIETTNLQTQNMTRGKLSFVDLAGSERVKKSGSTGENLKEAQAINKSLSALGDVISALATEQVHIPYRNHKLTMLMSDSLGGNAKTLMFVNVSPSDSNVDETQNSLLYATRVRTIKNDAKKDEANKDATRFKKMVDQWKEVAGMDPSARPPVDETPDEGPTEDDYNP